MLYWSQSPFLIWFTPLSQLPTFVYYSEHALWFSLCPPSQRTPAMQWGPHLPERNSALIFKTTMFHATYIETIKPHHWRSSSLQRKHRMFGDRQWVLRLPSSFRFDSTPKSLSIISHGLLWKTSFFSYFLCLRCKKAVGLWAWMSPWSLRLTQVSKWCLVLGISIGCNWERISRQK